MFITLGLEFLICSDSFMVVLKLLLVVSTGLNKLTELDFIIVLFNRKNENHLSVNYLLYSQEI